MPTQNELEALREMLRQWTVTGRVVPELQEIAADVLNRPASQVSIGDVRAALESHFEPYGGMAPNYGAATTGPSPGTLSTPKWQRLGTGKQMRTAQAPRDEQGMLIEPGGPSTWLPGHVTTPGAARQWPIESYFESFIGIPGPGGEILSRYDPGTVEGRLKIAKYLKKPWTSSYDYPDIYGPGDVVDPTTGAVSQGTVKHTHFGPMRTGETAPRVPAGVNIPMVFLGRDVLPEGQVQAPSGYIQEARTRTNKEVWFPKGKMPSFAREGTTWTPGQSIVPYQGAQPLDLGLGRYAGEVVFKGVTPIPESQRSGIREYRGQEQEGQWYRMAFEQRATPEYAQLMMRSGLFKHQVAFGRQVSVEGYEGYGFGTLKEPGAQAYAYWQAHPEQRTAALQQLGLSADAPWREVGYQLHEHYRQNIYPNIVEKKPVTLHNIPQRLIRAPFGTAEEGMGMYGDLPIERVRPVKGHEGYVDIITKPMEMVAGEWFTQLSREWPIRRHNVPSKEMRALSRYMPDLHAQLQEEALPRRQAYAGMVNVAMANAGRAVAPEGVVTPTQEQMETVQAMARARADEIAANQGVEAGDLQKGVMHRLLIEAAAKQFGGAPLQVGEDLLPGASHVQHFTTTGQYIFEEASAVGSAYAGAIEAFGTEREAVATSRATEATAQLAGGRNFFQAGMRAWTPRSRGSRLMLDPAIPANRVVMPERELVQALGLQGHPELKQLLKQYRSGEWSPKTVVFGQPTPGEEAFRGTFMATSPQYARKQQWLNLENLGQRMAMSPQAAQFLGRDADGDPIYAVAGEAVAYKEGQWVKTDLTGTDVFTEQQIAEGAQRAVDLGRPDLTRGEAVNMDVNPADLFALGPDDIRQAMVEDYARGHGKYIGRYYNLLEDAWTAARMVGRGEVGERLFRRVHGVTQGRGVLEPSLKKTMNLMATATKTGWSSDVLKQIEGIDVEDYERTMASGYSQSFLKVFETLAGGELPAEEVAQLTAGPGYEASTAAFVEQYRASPDRAKLMMQQGYPFDVLGPFQSRVQSPLGAALFASQLRRERRRALEKGYPFQVRLSKDIPQAEQEAMAQWGLGLSRQFEARKAVGRKLSAEEMGTTPMGLLTQKVESALHLGYGLGPFLSQRAEGPGKWGGVVYPSAVGGDIPKILVNALGRRSSGSGLGKGVSGGGSYEGEAGSLIHKQMESLFGRGWETELSVEGEVAGYPVSGLVDVWNPETQELLDIKTATSAGTDERIEEKYGHQLRLYAMLTGAKSAFVLAPKEKTVEKIRQLRGMFEDAGISSWQEATPEMSDLATTIAKDMYMGGGRRVEIDLSEEAMGSTRDAVREHAARQLELQRLQESGKLLSWPEEPPGWYTEKYGEEGAWPPKHYGPQIETADWMYRSAGSAPSGQASRAPGKSKTVPGAGADIGSWVMSRANSQASQPEEGDTPSDIMSWALNRAGLGSGGGPTGSGGGPPQKPPGTGASVAAGRGDGDDEFKKFLMQAFNALGGQGQNVPWSGGVPEDKFVNAVNNVSALFEDWQKAIKPAIDGTREFTEAEARITKRLVRYASTVERGLKHPEKTDMWGGAGQGAVSAGRDMLETGKLQSIFGAGVALELQQNQQLLEQATGSGGPGGSWLSQFAARGRSIYSGDFGPLAYGLFNLSRIWRYTGGQVTGAMQDYAGYVGGQQQAMASLGIGDGYGGVAGDVLGSQATMERARLGLGKAAWQTWGFIPRAIGSVDATMEPGVLQQTAALGGPLVGGALSMGLLSGIAGRYAASAGGAGATALTNLSGAFGFGALALGKLGAPLMGLQLGGALSEQWSSYEGEGFLDYATDVGAVLSRMNTITAYGAADMAGFFGLKGQRERLLGAAQRYSEVAEQREKAGESPERELTPEEKAFKAASKKLQGEFPLSPSQADKALSAYGQMTGRVPGVTWGPQDIAAAGRLSALAPSLQQQVAQQGVGIASATGVSMGDPQMAEWVEWYGGLNPTQRNQALRVSEYLQPIQELRRRYGIGGAFSQEQIADMSTQQAYQYGVAAQGLMGGDVRLDQLQTLDQLIGPVGGMELPTGQVVGGRSLVQPGLVTRGPGGMRIGTTVPLPYGMTDQAWMQAYQQGGHALQRASETGDFTDVGWGANTIWGLQDKQTALQIENQQQQFTFQQQALDLSRAYRYGGRYGGTELPTGATFGGVDFGRGMWAIQGAQIQAQRAYQQQQFGFQEQGINLSNWYQQQMFGLQEEQLNVQSQWQTQALQRQYGRQQVQFDWRESDLAFRGARTSLEFGWQMEDIGEAMRYATGRQRRQLMEQRDRATIRYGMQMGQYAEQEGRIDQQREWAEEDFELSKKHHQQRVEWQRERLELSRTYHNTRMQLQEERLQASREYFNEQAALQDEARRLQDQYWKANHARQEEQLAWAMAIKEQTNQIQDNLTNISRGTSLMLESWDMKMEAIFGEGGTLVDGMDDIEASAEMLFYYAQQIKDTLLFVPN